MKYGRSATVLPTVGSLYGYLCRYGVVTEYGYHILVMAVRYYMVVWSISTGVLRVVPESLYACMYD